MKPKIYRQGDVLIQKIAEIPKTAKPEKVDSRIILAYGEATGHHHSIKATKKTGFFKAPGDPASYLEIAEALALLEHQEHDTIQLPAGKYRVTIQQEYSPEEIRNVRD